MTPALKKFDTRLQQCIDSVIQGYGTSGAFSRTMRIDVEELGVVRVTNKLRNGVNAMCKQMKVPVEFVRKTRSFHFHINIGTVVMTPAQGEAYRAAHLKLTEAA